MRQHPAILGVHAAAIDDKPFSDGVMVRPHRTDCASCGNASGGPKSGSDKPPPSQPHGTPRLCDHEQQKRNTN
jgi:hypothetical protein